MWSEFTNVIGRMSQKPKSLIRLSDRCRWQTDVAVGQMSLLDRCRPITILWEGQRHKWRIYHELFHFLHRKSLIGRHLVLWDWNFITEYEGHVFRVATYLAHYWTITWLSSRRQTVISTVLDSDCLWTALLSTAGCKSRDTNRAILLDFKWSRDIDPALWFAPGLHLSTHCL